MNSLSISTAWDQTRAIIAKDGQLMLSVTLALIMIPVALTGLVDPLALEQTPPEDYEPTGLSLLIQFVAGLLGIVAQIAIIAMAFKIASSVGEAIRKGFSDLLAVIGVILLFVVAILALFIPLIAITIGFAGLAEFADLQPGTLPAAEIGGAAVLLILLFIAMVIFFGVRMSMVVPVRTAEGVGPIGMIKRSWALTRGHFWRILGFYLLFGIGVLIFAIVYMLVFGLIAELLFDELEPFSVGALYTGLVAGFLQAVVTVLSSTIVARIYAQLAAEPVASVPPTTA